MPPLTRNQQAARQSTTSSSHPQNTFHPDPSYSQQATSNLECATDSQIHPYESAVTLDNQASYEYSNDIPQENLSLIDLRRRSQIHQDQQHDFSQFSHLGQGTITNSNVSVQPLPAAHALHPRIGWNAIDNTANLNGNSNTAGSDSSGFEQVWKSGSQIQGNFNHNLSMISPTMPISASPIRRNEYGGREYMNQMQSIPTSQWTSTERHQGEGSISTERLHVYPAELQGHAPSSVDHTETISHQQAPQGFQQTPHSIIDQADLQLSNSHDGLVHIRGGIANAFSSNVRGRIISQSSSLSTSPSDRSTASTSYMVSPHAANFSKRYGHGDSSIDTSFESISNSAASMSADLSRCSSTSDDLMSIGGTSITSKKSTAKGKTKLRNIDRKLICEAANANPACRQEDLALRFGIERSTVSKTLKNKDKWLGVKEEGGGALIVKHRAGKFPLLEQALVEWAKNELKKSSYLLDATIKKRALEVAKEYGLSLDDFKASIGWIDKFRERNGIPKQGYISTFGNDATTNATKVDKAIEVDSNDALKPEHQSRSTSLLKDSLAISQEASKKDEALLGSLEEGNEIQELIMDKSSPLDGRHSRSQPSTSSLSEESIPIMTSTNEKPKACKRRHDETVDESDMSINLSLAKMQVKQELIGRDTKERDGKENDSSPIGEEDSSIEPVKGTKKATAKKRKADKKESQPSTTPPVVRKRKSRAKAKQTTSTQDTLQAESHPTTSSSLLPDVQMHPFNVAFVAPSLLMHRSVTSSEALPKEMETTRPVLNRIASSPAGAVNGKTSITKRKSKSTKTSGVPSPIEEDSGKEERSNLGLDTLKQSNIDTARPVTLEEARASLEIVLTFLSNQNGNLSPNDYLVLGNLQGTLTALAAQQDQRDHHSSDSTSH